MIRENRLCKSKFVGPTAELKAMFVLSGFVIFAVTCKKQFSKSIESSPDPGRLNYIGAESIKATTRWYLTVVPYTTCLRRRNTEKIQFDVDTDARFRINHGHYEDQNISSVFFSTTYCGTNVFAMFSRSCLILIISELIYTLFDRFYNACFYCIFDRLSTRHIFYNLNSSFQSLFSYFRCYFVRTGNSA